MPVGIRCRLSRWSPVRTALGAVAERILTACGNPSVDLSLMLVGDRYMRRLNRQYRGIDRSTDVLAFPMREAPGPKSPLLGDVVIALPTASRQAIAAKHSLDHEVATLLIHGVLHLAGYDHERGPREARRMKRKELAILRSLAPVPKLVRTVSS